MRSASFRNGARQPRGPRAPRAAATFNGANVSPPKDGMKHFLHIDDFNADELRAMLRNATVAKSAFRNRDASFKPFQDWTMAMIFTKPSARTRVSFETGFFRMGGHALYLDPNTIQIGKREATRDIARVVSRMNDVIMARLHGHADLLELAEFSAAPVINGLTDYNHPVQIMADALTVAEELGGIEGKRVVYIGDGNNIVHSWLRLAAVLPFDFVCCCPEGYEPDAATLELARRSGAGSSVTVSHEPAAAVAGADVVYTDVWASMGQKEEAEQRRRDFAGFMVDEALLGKAGPRCLLMHCLPAERGVEVSDGALEGPRSVVWAQAENRMHAQNGILLHVCNRM